MDINTSPDGQWHHFDLPNAWAYNFNTNCGCMKYQAIKDHLHVYIKPDGELDVYTLKASLNENDLLWNFRSCRPLIDSTTSKTKYYYGISISKPIIEKTIKLKYLTEDTFTIDTDNHSPGNYFWVAIPKNKTLTITDCLGHKLEGFGEDNNKTIDEIIMDGIVYSVYMRRSNIYISNVYTIKING